LKVALMRGYCRREKMDARTPEVPYSFPKFRKPNLRISALCNGKQSMRKKRKKKKKEGEKKSNGAYTSATKEEVQE
jgi:hypothetical protein